MIGERLKLARTASGLSLRQLSDDIDGKVTAQAIGKYERNESMPSSGVLEALSAALHVSHEYLMGDPSLVLESLEFRKEPGTSQREEARLEASVLDRLDRYLTVEETLGLPSVDWDQPREAPFPVHDLADADRAARSLRVHWGLGLNPIANMMELLEEKGIKALAFPLTKIDGMTAKVRRDGHPVAPVVVVNANHWGERQRFTAAHELGHLVIDVDSSLDDESAAHRFAGAFLMPAETLWAEIGKRRSSISLGELADLKSRFGVSIQAIAYRCKDLGIFNESLYKSLFKTFSQLGWRKPPYKEPGAMDGESPRRFERLCFRAAAENAISEAKAAELLNLTIQSFKQKMYEPLSMTLSFDE